MRFYILRNLSIGKERDSELNSNLQEVNNSLNDYGRMVEIAAGGTYWQANTNISLYDYVGNYKEIIIRTGWNANANAGFYHHRLPVFQGGSYVAQIPCYGQGATIFMSVTINSALNYIHIDYSNFSSSNARAIRNIYGVK